MQPIMAHPGAEVQAVQSREWMMPRAFAPALLRCLPGEKDTRLFSVYVCDELEIMMLPAMGGQGLIKHLDSVVASILPPALDDSEGGTPRYVRDGVHRTANCKLVPAIRLACLSVDEAVFVSIVFFSEDSGSVPRNGVPFVLLACKSSEDASPLPPFPVGGLGMLLREFEHSKLSLCVSGVASSMHKQLSVALSLGGGGGGMGGGGGRGTSPNRSASAHPGLSERVEYIYRPPASGDGEPASEMLISSEDPYHLALGSRWGRDGCGIAGWLLRPHRGDDDAEVTLTVTMRVDSCTVEVHRRGGVEQQHSENFPAPRYSHNQQGHGERKWSGRIWESGSDEDSTANMVMCSAWARKERDPVTVTAVFEGGHLARALTREVCDLVSGDEGSGQVWLLLNLAPEGSDGRAGGGHTPKAFSNTAPARFVFFRGGGDIGFRGDGLVLVRECTITGARADTAFITHRIHLDPPQQRARSVPGDSEGGRSGSWRGSAVRYNTFGQERGDFVAETSTV